MILVCGDAMRDVYWHGEVTRISPEAPVPVLLVTKVEEREGAAANVANNIRAMGVECMSNFGAQRDRIMKIRQVGKNQHMLRADFDHPQVPVQLADWAIDAADIVVFVDYGKGALSNVRDLIRRCKAAGKTVLVDPKGYDYERYQGADVVKPNLDEMRVMVGGWKDEQDLANKVEDIKEKAQIGSVLLTRGSQGMTLYSHWAYSVYAEAQEVVDVSGAGETALAAFAVALHRGSDLYGATKYANKAAGIAVRRFGTAVIREEEVFEADTLPRHV